MHVLEYKHIASGKVLFLIMEFLSILQTATYTASIAIIVTVFTAAQSACLNGQESERRRRRRPYQPPIRYERFEFNLDDWPDSLIVNRLRYVAVKLDIYIYIYILINIDFPRQRFAKFFLIFGLIYVNGPIELSLPRS